MSKQACNAVFSRSMKINNVSFVDFLRYKRTYVFLKLDVSNRN